MSTKPSWATEDFDSTFEMLSLMGGELSILYELLISNELAGRVYPKITSFMKDSIADHNLCDLKSLLVNYHVSILSLLMDLKRVDKFTAPSVRKIAQRKIIKSCDDIIINLDKVGINEVPYKANSSDFINEMFIRADVRIDIFVDIKSVINEIRRSAISMSQSYIKKVNVRDAEFVYFCRGLKALNEERLGTPYWESIVFFAYGLIPNAPDGGDRMTTVRNACDVRSIRVAKQ